MITFWEIVAVVGDEEATLTARRNPLNEFCVTTRDPVATDDRAVWSSELESLKALPVIVGEPAPEVTLTSALSGPPGRVELSKTLPVIVAPDWRLTAWCWERMVNPRSRPVVPVTVTAGEAVAPLSMIVSVGSGLSATRDLPLSRVSVSA